MTQSNGIAHIEESNNRSYCGRSLVMQFKLTDLAHAEACIASGTRVTPCAVCLNLARAAQPTRLTIENCTIDDSNSPIYIKGTSR